MPRYQLEIAIALNASAVCSAVLFYLNRTTEGKIQLPVHADRTDEIYPDGDPFDVITPEDLLDGYPLDEAKFWARMRIRKIIVSVLLLALVVVQGVSLGLGSDITLYMLHIWFALYALSIAASSVRRHTVPQHSESVWYLASPTIFPVALMGFTAILPLEDPPIIALEHSILPSLWYTALALYVLTAQAITNKEKDNVSGVYGASPWGILFFSYSTKVIMLGNTAASLEIGDLPILTTDLRTTFQYTSMKRGLCNFKLSIGSWRPKQRVPAVKICHPGATLAYQLARVNQSGLVSLFLLSVFSGVCFYMPPFFLSQVLRYLENDPNREHTGWGWVWVMALFASNSISNATLQARIRAQLNTVLFAKTLVRKDIASSVASPSPSDAPPSDAPAREEKEFSSKAQIMTLMTTDVDRVGKFTNHIFTVIDAPIELVVGTVFLYKLLGVSCFFGLGVAVFFLPLNHFAGSIVAGAQDKLMKSRDERVALMNEVLGGIRMLKFMAWERSFEARIMEIRARELKHQRLNYIIQVRLAMLQNMTPIVATLVSFYHFAVFRGQTLTPSIAFTSSVISLRRIEKYLNTAEVMAVPPIRKQSPDIAFQSCTVTWPQDRSPSSAAPSAASTPRYNFVLVDLTLKFPPGELSLICGKLGSGKSLLLLALLGEADVLSGRMMCPRSPADSMASFEGVRPMKENWVIQGICAYVPQLRLCARADSDLDNILFNLPYDEERYNLTFTAFRRPVCALVSDLEILEDGDESEIGERGVNLSGGQKARDSRASILLLDDVLSAVDAHTAHHLYHSCLKGELMQGRTVILVSHHVQLSGYVVALDNGRVQFQGARDQFQSSAVMAGLVQSTTAEVQDVKEETAIAALDDKGNEGGKAVAETSPISKAEPKASRKYVEDEQRAVGRVAWSVWKAYILACGSGWYWALFFLVFVVAALAPLMENGWLSYWSRGDDSNSPLFYLAIYTALIYFLQDHGSIHASTVLYQKLLQAVLFAHIRFHDTVSRGRLLNRFGKDFEGLDSNLSDNFGRSTIHVMSVITTVSAISFVGGPPFIVAAFFIGIIYYQTARDMRRLGDTRSPLYSMYSETIAGVGILRAFGASSKFLRDMLRHVDTNANPGYWTWGINRWLSIRLTSLASGNTALLALLAVLNKNISASLAGFALTFANIITYDLILLVGLERIKEYSDLAQEPPEFIEPRPHPSWPQDGAIRCENLVIRYAPELPDVLHNLTFEVNPGSGKSTLALSFFRFVEATEGRIVVDGLDIAQIGLTDLRNRLTIIPQDPTILSGTLRSTLDVFNEYQDADIFEALRRVHLIPSEDTPEEAADTVNANMFRNLDSSVSEGGENFSTGEKQLLCMARAILKRTKILVMDESSSWPDAGRLTSHSEFKASTILTIAHRLRTVIDYDKVMLLDQGRIAEFDRPSTLLANPASKFHALCKATGRRSSRC
ncbi:ATP-binding cassette transporter [Mycena epipterygia]|nr:ATP-binding cassette transporter [Mycena epipterygia]